MNRSDLRKLVTDQELAQARSAVDVFVVRYGVTKAQVLADPGFMNALQVQAKGIGRKQLESALRTREVGAMPVGIPSALRSWVGKVYNLSAKGLRPIITPEQGNIYLAIRDLDMKLHALKVGKITTQDGVRFDTASEWLSGPMAGQKEILHGAPLWWPNEYQPVRAAAQIQVDMFRAPKEKKVEPVKQMSMFGTTGTVLSQISFKNPETGKKALVYLSPGQEHFAFAGEQGFPHNVVPMNSYAYTHAGKSFKAAINAIHGALINGKVRPGPKSRKRSQTTRAQIEEAMKGLPPGEYEVTF